jgi:hypothetical protein
MAFIRRPLRVSLVASALGLGLLVMCGRAHAAGLTNPTATTRGAEVLFGDIAATINPEDRPWARLHSGC